MLWIISWEDFVFFPLKVFRNPKILEFALCKKLKQIQKHLNLYFLKFSLASLLSIPTLALIYFKAFHPNFNFQNKKLSSIPKTPTWTSPRIRNSSHSRTLQKGFPLIQITSKTRHITTSLTNRSLDQKIPSSRNWKKVGANLLNLKTKQIWGGR